MGSKDKKEVFHCPFKENGHKYIIEAFNESVKCGIIENKIQQMDETLKVIKAYM